MTAYVFRRAAGEGGGTPWAGEGEDLGDDALRFLRAVLAFAIRTIHSFVRHEPDSVRYELVRGTESVDEGGAYEELSSRYLCIAPRMTYRTNRDHDAGNLRALCCDRRIGIPGAILSERSSGPLCTSENAHETNTVVWTHLGSQA